MSYSDINLKGDLFKPTSFPRKRKWLEADYGIAMQPDGAIALREYGGIMLLSTERS